MKKMVIVLMLFITCFICLDEVRALPQCNIGVCGISETGDKCEKGYGSVIYKTDNSVANYTAITVCKSGLAGKCVSNPFDIIEPGYDYNTAKARSVLIEWNANNNKKHVIKTASFELYETKNDTKPVCQVSLNADGKTVASVSLNVSHGKVYKVVAKGTYVDENGKKQSFENTSMKVRKVLAENEKDIKNDDTNQSKPIESSGTGSSYGENSFDENGQQKYTTTSKSNAGETAREEIGDLTPTSGFTCDKGIKDLIHDIWKIIMILSPIGLLILLTVDFLKAMVQGDPDAIKKSSSNAIKRTIAALVLLALPWLLSTIFGLFGLPFCF